jgi:hypothetical protein
MFRGATIHCRTILLRMSVVWDRLASKNEAAGIWMQKRRREAVAGRDGISLERRSAGFSADALRLISWGEALSYAPWKSPLETGTTRWTRAARMSPPTRKMLQLIKKTFDSATRKVVCAATLSLLAGYGAVWNGGGTDSGIRHLRRLLRIRAAARRRLRRRHRERWR